MDYVPVSSPPQKKVERYVTILALIVTLGPLFYGFEGMVLNGAIRAVGSEFNLNVFAKGVAGAAGIIGGLIGASIAGRLSDHIGRRGVLILVGPALLFEAIFGALSPWLGGYPFLLLCRVIGGMGFGSATTVAPGYVAEVSPERIRGRLISFRQLAIILGLFSAAIVNLIATKVAGDSTAAVFLGLKAWQVMFLCLLVPALVYMILTPLIPESPRYLVVKNRLEEADKVLRKLTGQNDISGKIREIQDSLGGQNATLGILAVLKSKWRTLVMVGMAIAAFQQLTGTNGIFFYSNMLFEAVGIPESAAFLQTLILSVFKIVGVTTGILLVDRVGRKNMLIYGGTLMFIALGTVATVFLVAPTGKNGSDISSSPILGFLAVASLCLFLLGFTSSWGPIFSVLMGEMFPNQIRGSAMSLSAGADFFFNLLVVLLFPYLVSWSPSATYWIYCFFGVLAVIFTKKYVQETKGKSLEDMGK
ncbi:sugar porter family MFS transporter [Mobiluncus mulieris]|uniref:MFS transporter, SP family n=2 Tax=Mobiluncus mulieris TaxID=2052 RepID=E0QNX7_9ACTO|nr:sugar porter family MFS transporter [Mobiluncus mulieris]EEJ52931.1 MFS transporter, SP family [Mobiluncus mulieris ATCC 35243]EFM46710.1 MFS transporter, SP family [Mobiluncus mulieris ATCC 35239]MCU9971590.1 sugar porter family MFS transporter [Mobiluncus mulieris]MCU9976128.1 sugar porter family MFS transporter [Mobiluncus mulieris]MCU9994567.1 sugar porter family MFS transporter [Mobiluncus mulieris]